LIHCPCANISSFFPTGFRFLRKLFVHFDPAFFPFVLPIRGRLGSRTRGRTGAYGAEAPSRLPDERTGGAPAPLSPSILPHFFLSIARANRQKGDE